MSVSAPPFSLECRCSGPFVSARLSLYMMKYVAGTTPQTSVAMETRSRLPGMGGMARAHLLTKAAGSRCSGSTRFRRRGTMPDTRLDIRLDLTSGDRIRPGKIALLEAIQASGSISGAARRWACRTAAPGCWSSRSTNRCRNRRSRRHRRPSGRRRSADAERGATH